MSGTFPERTTARVLPSLLVCLGLLMVLPGCKKGPAGGTKASEFEVDKVYERGPVTVHIRLDKTKLSIADTLLLQFEATLQPGYRIEMPKVDKVLENFGIVDWDNLGEKLDAKNNVVTTYQYRLEPFLSGNYEIPAFTFEFRDVNDPNATHELTSEPIAVEVASLLGDQRTKLVIEDIEDVVEMPRPARRWWLLGLGAIVLATVPAGWLLLRGRRARQLVRIFKPAHEVAYARLKVLVALNLVEQGRIKEFYERISGILRHYIEDRFDLHAPERTTEEFLAELRGAELFVSSDKQMLEEFLTHCDLVKFAKHEPPTEQIQRTFDLVKGFIERTKSDERRVDVTDQVEAGQTTREEAA
ncbi:MAG: BatD family protein [Phycisphaerales bacterium]